MGPTGATGPTGLTGATGPRGPTGPPGQSAVREEREAVKNECGQTLLLLEELNDTMASFSWREQNNLNITLLHYAKAAQGEANMRSFYYVLLHVFSSSIDRTVLEQYDGDDEGPTF